jgi:hypothetical protein
VREVSAKVRPTVDGDFSFRDYRARVLDHRIGHFLRRRVVVARLVYRIQGRRLLRFLWRNFGSLAGWLAEHHLVDWGE